MLGASGPADEERAAIHSITSLLNAPLGDDPE